MLDITNGVNTFTVTNGAYEGLFKQIGYKPVNEKVVEVDEATKADDVAEELESEVNLMEKPIGNWTKAELASFAEENGINLDGVKKINEVRALVKEFIDVNMSE